MPRRTTASDIRHAPKYPQTKNGRIAKNLIAAHVTAMTTSTSNDYAIVYRPSTFHAMEKSPAAKLMFAPKSMNAIASLFVAVSL